MPLNAALSFFVIAPANAAELELEKGSGVDREVRGPSGGSEGISGMQMPRQNKNKDEEEKTDNPVPTARVQVFS